MPEEPLSRRQVELILRRTTELEARKSGAESTDLITTADLERVAADLGLPADALRQAIAESRAGVLADPAEKTTADKLFGEALVECRRFVPGTLAGVRAAVERFLDTQGFQKRRHQGEVTVWEASSSMSSHMRRAFRAGPYRLPREITIEARVAQLAGGPHPILVQLRVDATQARKERIGVGGATAALTVGAAVTGVVLAPTLPLDIVIGSTGAISAGVIGWATRATHLGAMSRTELALQRFLDFLEHEPDEAAAPAEKKDLVSRVVSFLQDELFK
jgi:hypothetical protein